MSFDPKPQVKVLQARLRALMDAHSLPHEAHHGEATETLGPCKVYPVIESFKPKARVAAP